MARLTARWCEGVVPAIGVVAHGGPTGLDGGRWCGRRFALWLAGANLLVRVAANELMKIEDGGCHGEADGGAAGCALQV